MNELFYAVLYNNNKLNIFQVIGEYEIKMKLTL